MELLKSNGIKIIGRKLREIQTDCEICIKKDGQIIKSKGLIETINPGEMVRADLLEIESNKYAIIAIDYFKKNL